jgi:hypothetical protein
MFGIQPGKAPKGSPPADNESANYSRLFANLETSKAKYRGRSSLYPPSEVGPLSTRTKLQVLSEVICGSAPMGDSKSGGFADIFKRHIDTKTEKFFPAKGSATTTRISEMDISRLKELQAGLKVAIDYLGDYKEGRSIFSDRKSHEAVVDFLSKKEQAVQERLPKA